MSTGDLIRTKFPLCYKYQYHKFTLGFRDFADFRISRVAKHIYEIAWPMAVYSSIGNFLNPDSSDFCEKTRDRVASLTLAIRRFDDQPRTAKRGWEKCEEQRKIMPLRVKTVLIRDVICQRAMHAAADKRD